MRFMKALSRAFLMLLVFCGAAAANVAYTTVDASYTSFQDFHDKRRSVSCLLFTKSSIVELLVQLKSLFLNMLV